MLLLLGAELDDPRADERGLDRDHGADRGVAAADLLDDEAVAEVVEAGAAVLLRDDRAEVALRGDLLDELDVEVVVAGVFARLLDDLVVGELARGALDQLLLVGQVEVHVSSPLACVGGSCQLAMSPRPRPSARAVPSRRAASLGCATGVHAPLDLLGEALDRQALLRERVALAQRHRPVLEALVVDGQAERRADLVLAAVALADRAAVVVLDHAHARTAAQRAVDLARELGLAVLAHERQDRRLDRRQARVQSQDRAQLALARALALDQFLVVGVDEERERRAVGAGGGLDHVGDVALAGCSGRSTRASRRRTRRAG